MVGAKVRLTKMPRIFLPTVNEYREINRIVAFGCSQTAGSELLDSKRYPNIPDVELKKHSLGIEGWHKYSANESNLPLHFKIQDEERMLAWPAQLAKLYNIPIHNYAEPATGNEQQMAQFLKAKSEGVISNDTLVLWGFTSMNRGFWIDQEQGCSYYLLGNNKIFKQPVDINMFNEKLWYNGINSDYMLAWRYYQSLSTIFHWANEICNEQFLFIQALHYSPSYEQWSAKIEGPVNPTVELLMQRFWDTIKYNYEIKYPIFKDFEQTNLFTWSKSIDGRLGCGHPTLDAHEKYALLIKNELDRLEQESS